MPGSSSTSVMILGAGLTGMSAALRLAERGVPSRIVERAAQPGGLAVTLEDSGYRFDRTGHLLHLRDPSRRARVLEWLEGEVLEIQRRSMVWSHDTYTRYPFQANTYGLPPQVAYACLQGFIDAHFAPDKPEPKNFEEFCRLHFGEGISEHFMLPYNARLWGVPPSEITSAWCQRFVPLPKLEDVVAGSVGLNDRELGYNTSFLYPRRGIGELPRAMAARLPQLELSRAPERIHSEERWVQIEGARVGYDALVSSLPLPSLVALFERCPPEVKAAAARLRCTHLYYLDVALDVPCGRPYHWIYVPEARYPFYRVGCYSHFSSEMAPPGKAGLYVELADRAEPKLDELLPRVTQALEEMGLIRAPSDVAFVRLRRIDHAYVIFDHAYEAALATVQEYLASHHIISTGRYGGWTYSSMEDALENGEAAAEQVLGRSATP